MVGEAIVLTLLAISIPCTAQTAMIVALVGDGTEHGIWRSCEI